MAGYQGGRFIKKKQTDSVQMRELESRCCSMPQLRKPETSDKRDGHDHSLTSQPSRKSVGYLERMGDQEPTLTSQVSHEPAETSVIRESFKTPKVDSSSKSLRTDLQKRDPEQEENLIA